MEEYFYEMSSRIRGVVSPYDLYGATLANLYLKKIEGNKLNCRVKELLKSIEDEDISFFIDELFDRYPSLINVFNSINITKFNFNSLKVFEEENINNLPTENATPKCLVELCKQLLEIKESDDVLDLCSGNGNFLFNVSNTNKYKSLSGVELNTTSVAISKIKAALTDSNYKIYQNDCFVFKGKQYSKIFSNYPLGMQVRYVPTAKEIVDELKNKSYGNLTSADWAFNYKVCELLNEDGRAVVISTNGSLMNNSEKRIREFFLKNNLIETVIALPEKLFKFTSIPVNIIILSKKKKNGVRFVDARNIFVKGRRNNDLSLDNLNRILELCSNDSEISKEVEYTEIFNENSTLTPARYLETPAKKIEDGIEFGSVIKSITRGAQLSGADLDNIISTEETDTQYLMISNVKDGLIDDDLPNLKSLDSKFEKYLIHDKNIVMSKNGYPFKIAVFERKNEKKVLANGNMFVIEIDESKMNPYYIKAFFDSEAGISSLKSIVAGATIPNISQESLKHVLIPNISLEKQQEIVNKYLAKKDEIEYLKKQLVKAIDSLNHIID